MKKTFIIAELGNAHEGSIGLAKKMIEAVAECGVDAVKFQTHIFEAESLKDAPNSSWFQGESREEYLIRTAFNLEEHKELKKFSEDLGLEYISSSFSLEAIDLLEQVGVKTHKIPSGEVNNLPYLEKLAKTGKKILLSTGMSSWEEIDKAVSILKGTDLVVLQCTTKYPCPAEEAGLDVMLKIKEKYNIPVGLSDHTENIAIPIAAVVLGARVIEKHFTLSKKMYGSDAPYATEPKEFKYMVDCIREVEKSLNSNVDKDKIVEGLKETKVIFEKSVVSAKELKKGTKLTMEDLSFKKPGDGIHVKNYKEIIGKELNKDVPEDYKFKQEDLI